MSYRRTMGAVILNESVSADSVVSPGAKTSPLRRRSLATIPRVNLQRDIIQNDDESEILARRRKEKVLDGSRTLDTTERRASLGLVAGLSTTEIFDHYNKCLKLCAENKINSKNVFALSMIDYMAVLNKRDMNSNNMQTAGTTLDVSTKIYGVRVDCVYTDAFKMAGDPGKQEESKGNQIEAGNTEANTSNVEEFEVKKKKRHRAQQIFCSAESLTSETELVNLCAKSNNGDTQTTDMLLQITFPIHTINGHSLHVYADVIFDLPLNKGKENGAIYSDEDVPCVDEFGELELCPRLSNFDFLGWSEDDIQVSNSPEPIEAEDEIRFDIDASLADPFEEDNVGMDYFDLDNDSQENVDRCGRIGREEAERIVDFRGSVAEPEQKEKNVEYSYLQKNVDLFHWAGPIHWRPKQLNKLPNGSRVVGACRQEGVRKKKELSMEYTKDVAMAFVDKAKSKIPKKLQNKTVRQAWQEDRITLPEDVHYDSKNSIKFYLHLTKIKPLQHLISPNADAGEDVDATVVEEGVNYDYNNLNDTQDYCSQNNAEGNDDEDNNVDAFENPDHDQDNEQSADVYTQGLTGQNLVAAPKSTTQIQINYATRAKKIDMRQLKRSIWNALTMENQIETRKKMDGDGLKNGRDSVFLQIKDAREFSTIYKQLPNYLGKDNTAALTPALAFSSLLHLANERSLSIMSVPDMSDLKISQG